MRRLVITTTALVVFGAGLFNLALPAKESSVQAGVGLKFAIGQEGSPLHIQGTQSIVASGAYNRVTVRNVSARVVTGATFAVRAVAKPGSQANIPLHEGAPVETKIEPGAIFELTANVLSQHQLDEFARANLGGGLELGVLRVQFADGGSWASSVNVTGRFNGKVFAGNLNEGLPCAVKNVLVTAFFSGIGLGLSAQSGHFRCIDVLTPTYCSNNLSSCTEAICENPTLCPKQECSYVPPPAPIHTQ